MLAYVFSHRPAADTDVTAYEDALRRFHAELARSGAAGFVTSTTYLAGGEYSDWYLVESSAALDAINEAAVSGSRSAPHDAAARMAASGSGKLLRLANGRPDLEAPYEIGFSKPAGMPYPALYESVDHFGRVPVAPDDGPRAAARVLPGLADSGRAARRIRARGANAPSDLSSRTLHH